MIKLTKGLIITVWINIAVMVIWGAISWSRGHLTEMDYNLYLSLGGIFGVFLLTGTQEQGIKRTMDWITALMFLGILAFGVNSPLAWVHTAHLIFTGLGIVSALVNNYVWQEKGVMKNAALLSGANVLLVFFFLAYKGNAMTIAMGEAIAAIPPTILVFLKLKTYKQLKS